MVIITKTCNISVVAIHTSLQPSICQFMIGHKHPGIFTVSDMGGDPYPITGQLYNLTWINLNPIHLL